jgi:hypothetical protein
VWNFELPLVPSEKSAFRSWHDNSKATQIELLRHKASPTYGTASWTTEFADNYGMNSVNVGFWSGVGWAECAADSGNHMKAPPAVADVQAKVAQYDKRLYRYAYFMDEPFSCMKYPGFPDKVKAFAKALQDGGAVPYISYPPDDRVWMPGPYVWLMSIKDITDAHAAEMARARDAGQSIWSYHVLMQDNYSPKWYLDYPPINERIHSGFMNQSVQATGMCCWATDYYPESQNSTVWDSVGGGESIFVYHGARVGVEGVVGGVRLKAFREGFEDFEYVEMLKKDGEEEFAMDKIKTVAAGPATWTKNPDELYQVRKDLGDKLAALNTPTLNWCEHAKQTRAVWMQSTATGIRISAMRLVAVEIFDLRGNRIPLDGISRRVKDNDIVVTGLPRGAFVVRVNTRDRQETAGFVRF